jgi:hypothetical protein
MESPRQALAPPGPPPRTRAAQLPRLGVALLVLAGGLVANSVAGRLLLGWVDYPISDSVLNQLLGLEVITLLLAVPALITAGVLALRSDPLAPVLGFGPTAYAAYMFVQYVVGPEYSTYSLAVVGQVVITGLAGLLTVWTWTLTSLSPLPRSGPRRSHRRAVLLGALAGFVLLRYLPGLFGALTDQPIPEEFLDARSFYWSIFLLDLGVVVPWTALAAVAVWRGGPVAERAYLAVLAWFVLVPPSVAAMAAVMVARDDSNASVPDLALLSAVAVAFAVPAALALRTLVRARQGASPTF